MKYKHKWLVTTHQICSQTANSWEGTQRSLYTVHVSLVRTILAYLRITIRVLLVFTGAVISLQKQVSHQSPARAWLVSPTLHPGMAGATAKQYLLFIFKAWKMDLTVVECFLAVQKLFEGALKLPLCLLHNLLSHGALVSLGAGQHHVSAG